MASNFQGRPQQRPRQTDFFDILVIGRTGLGKSSTVDKLMTLLSQEPGRGGYRPRSLSRGDAHRASRQQRLDDDSVAIYTSDHLHGLPDESQAEVWKIKGDTGEIILGDLSARVLSGDDNELKYTGKRLENIDFVRRLVDIPVHTEIDRLRNDPNQRTSVYRSSQCSHLLTNHSSKIRVLDAPGFFSPDRQDGAQTNDESNLMIVRQILRLQEHEGLNICRVLYFLPSGLNRADRVLQSEIQQLVKYFQKSIFKPMVLVGTMPLHISSNASLPSEVKFPKEAQEMCKQSFEGAVQRELEERKINSDDVAEPRLIFIEMTDTCEKVFKKIKSALDDDAGDLRLKLNTQTCSQCAIEIASTKNVCEYRRSGQAAWTNAIPYNDSFCHPQFKKVITLSSVLQGFVNLFILKWCFSEDRCVNPDCNKRPGSRGCMKIGKRFRLPASNEEVCVDHTTQVD